MSNTLTVPFVTGRHSKRSLAENVPRVPEPDVALTDFSARTLPFALLTCELNLRLEDVRRARDAHRARDPLTGDRALDEDCGEHVLEVVSIDGRPHCDALAAERVDAGCRRV